MASIAPPKAADAPQASSPPRISDAGPAAQAAEDRFAEHVAEAKNARTPAKVAVSLDSQAQRFVSTLTDPITSEMLRKYPSESQLAYSRAVMAYLRAQIGK